MNPLIERLKVTKITTTKPTEIKAKVTRTIKLPGAIAAKVAPVVKPAAKPPVSMNERTNEVLLNGMRNKIAEQNSSLQNNSAAAIIKQVEEDYLDFQRELELLEQPQEAKKTETMDILDATPVPASEIPLANGISVGEEAGGSIVIPVRRSRKKKTQSVQQQTASV